jgi:hypothetical protein
MGGLDGPPKPPALGSAPAKPWRSSGSLRGFAGLDGPPKPAALGDAPAKPWRSSGSLRGLGGLEGAKMTACELTVPLEGVFTRRA